MPTPAIFFGHGNPLNAIQQNNYTEAWSAIGESLPRPSAILAISAHWYLPATLVTAMPAPRTIHARSICQRWIIELCRAYADKDCIIVMSKLM